MKLPLITDKQKRALEHYHIDMENFEGVKILFAEKDTTNIALSSIISECSKHQQTIIDYDEEYDMYVISIIPKAYGESGKDPEEFKKPLKFGLRDLEKGGNCSGE